MIACYCRVSTEDQSLARQLEAGHIDGQHESIVLLVEVDPLEGTTERLGEQVGREVEALRPAARSRDW